MSAPNIQSTPTSAPQPEVPCDLGSLSRVQLNSYHQDLLKAAQAKCAGRKVWQHRKMAEATDLARLAQLSGRLVILKLDLGVELRAELLLKVTVPCLPDPSGPLHVAEAAHLGLVYREDAMLLPQPGYSFIQIMAPRQVWHPQVSADGYQVLCVGNLLPAGIPAKELILLCYTALCMVTTQLDPRDAGGVFNSPDC
jgi:hypothetical protein